MDSLRAGAIWVPPSGVMPVMRRLMEANGLGFANGHGPLQEEELSKMSTPTMSTGRRFSTTPMAATRAD